MEEELKLIAPLSEGNGGRGELKQKDKLLIHFITFYLISSK